MLGESWWAILTMAGVVVALAMVVFAFGYDAGRRDEAEERRRRRLRSLHAMRRLKQSVQRTSRANVLAEMERVAAVRWVETRELDDETD